MTLGLFTSVWMHLSAPKNNCRFVGSNTQIIFPQQAIAIPWPNPYQFKQMQHNPDCVMKVQCKRWYIFFFITARGNMISNFPCPFAQNTLLWRWTSIGSSFLDHVRSICFRMNSERTKFSVLRVFCSKSCGQKQHETVQRLRIINLVVPHADRLQHDTGPSLISTRVKLLFLVVFPKG